MEELTSSKVATHRARAARLLRGRPAFVTGADGFVGSHLVDELVGAGSEVFAFVRATSSGGLHNLEDAADRIEVIKGNLEDRHSVYSALRILQDAAPKPIIFHLGAQAHVGDSWKRPYDTMLSNAIGTLNLLQSIIDLDMDIYKFDAAGTSEEYGNYETDRTASRNPREENHLVLHERSPINPKSIYATSKLATDFLTMNYSDAYGLPGVVTRMFNNYGPRQNPTYITGTVITQALERPRVVLGNLQTMRDFCYISDGVRGHLDVALFGHPGEVYCYGYGQNITIRDWARLILKIGEQEGYWKGRRIVSSKERFRPGQSDVERLKVGYDKLHALTGWDPIVSWEEGIQKTIAWYAQHPEKWRDRIDWS